MDNDPFRVFRVFCLYSTKACMYDACFVICAQYIMEEGSRSRSGLHANIGGPFQGAYQGGKHGYT